MATIIMNVFKGQRIDMTAQMKDADKILEVFRNHNVRFDKKFTSINHSGPSTITFKGLKAEKIHSDITDAVVECYQLAKNDEVGNVYLKFTSFINPKYIEKKEKNDDEPKADDSKETEETRDEHL